ncbi:MAG: hypothetical protein MR270_04805 [Erysipelotrichaceae bacterium]|nr:hypothetical protein [Erysipelotrichaceae bacterium]
MENYIYDYYGYKVDKLIDNQFEYQGYIFKLLATIENEEEVNKLNQLSLNTALYFNNDVVFLVKNKYDHFISAINDEKNICLISYKKDGNVTVKDVVSMHQIWLNAFSYQINLQEIIILWDQRLEFIQNQCLVNLNFDNEAHETLYRYTIYAIGFALNALQYLSDINIDFQRNYYLATLTHRRIKKMDKENIFNPFNLIVDHSSRDLAELYKNELISFEILISICKQYNYSVDEYEYLLARLLFPTFIFDVCEDIANDHTSYDYSSEIYYAIAKQKRQIELMKNYYKKINEMINIRPITWITSNI